MDVVVTNKTTKEKMSSSSIPDSLVRIENYSRFTIVDNVWLVIRWFTY